MDERLRAPPGRRRQKGRMEMTTGYMTTPSVKDVKALDHDNIRLTCDTVFAEVLRQDVLARAGKFGGTHILPGGPDHARLAVLTEEVGEVARELNEALIQGHLARDALVKELVQVGACAVAWATALESGQGS